MLHITSPYIVVQNKVNQMLMPCWWLTNIKDWTGHQFGDLLKETQNRPF